MALKIEPAELEIVRELLRAHAPGIEVWAFGSRVHGENLKPFSDLDLVLVAKTPLGALRLAELRDAFVESALPYKVDLIDWSSIDENFRTVIRKSYLVVVTA